MNQPFYFIFVDRCFDWNWVVIEDADQTILDVRSIDVFRMIQEKVHPSGNINPIIFELDSYFLKQNIAVLEDFFYLFFDRPVLRWFVIYDILKRLIQDVKDFDKDLSEANLNVYFLNVFLGCFARIYFLKGLGTEYFLN